MKKSFLSLAIVLSSYCSYAQISANSGNTANPRANTAVSLRLNLNEASGAAEKELFDNVRFIPLETNAKSLFGHITQLEVTNDYFIILDRDTNCILFFDKTGKFHNKIDGGDKQFNPRKIIHKFIVNRFAREVVFKTNEVYCTYDFDGVKKREEAVRSTKMSDRMCFLPNGNFVVNNNYGHTGEKQGSFLSFYEKNGAYATALPYSDADYLNGDVAGGGGSEFCYSKGNNTLLYTKSYDYNIYSITDQSVKTNYKLIFTVNNALPNDFLSNPVYAGKRLAFLKENIMKVYSITNSFQIANYLFFRANSYDYNTSKNFMYNLKSGRLIAYDKITPDETSYYLPIAYNGLDYINNGLTIGEDGYVYTNISSLDLLTSQNNLKNKKSDLSSELAKFMDKKDKQSNPVMIQIHLKS